MLLADFSQLETIPPDSRRLLGEEGRDVKLKATAIFGASFRVRVLTNLIVTALALFNKTPNPTEFFKSEAEARVWLTKHRGS